MFVCAVMVNPAEMQGKRYPVVLMYHLIEEEPFTELTDLFVSPDDFEDQLMALKNAGYEFAFASDYGPVSKNAPKRIIITFDDGYADNYTKMLPIVEKCGAKASVFVVTGFIGNKNFMTEDQLKLMAQSPYIELGSHTESHIHVDEQERYRIMGELLISKQKLQRITGQNVSTLTFPEGHTSRKVNRIAARPRYYKYAFTTHNCKPGFWTNNYAIPRIKVERGVSGDELLRIIEDAQYEIAL